MIWTLLSITAAAAWASSNPFDGNDFYVNPFFQSEIQGTIDTLPCDDPTRATLEEMKGVASAFWVDTKDKINGTSTNGTTTVRDILADASSMETVPLVVFIVYDAPNRDCAASASRGEICCTYADDGESCDLTVEGDCSEGLAEYENEYINPFAQVLAEFNGKVPVVLVLEPDSLPNLATNQDFPACENSATEAGYKGAATIAASTLSEACPDSCTLYLDAAHGGWLGWSTNLDAFVSLVADLGILPLLRGFSTNVANYQPLGTSCEGEPCAAFQPLPSWYTATIPLGSRPDTTATTSQIPTLPTGIDAEAQRRPSFPSGSSFSPKEQTVEEEAASACCTDPCGLLEQGNPANNEMNYAWYLAEAFRDAVPEFNPKIITDTGRNGVSDMRSDCSNWCNIRGAGVGLQPTATTNTSGLIDAFFWLKPPGESDGCTETLPSGAACPRYDLKCGSEDSIGSEDGEPSAPEAGDWFEYAVTQLAANAAWTPQEEDDDQSCASDANCTGCRVCVLEACFDCETFAETCMSMPSSTLDAAIDACNATCDGRCPRGEDSECEGSTTGATCVWAVDADYCVDCTNQTRFDEQCFPQPEDFVVKAQDECGLVCTGRCPTHRDGDCPPPQSCAVTEDGTQDQCVDCTPGVYETECQALSDDIREAADKECETTCPMDVG